MFGGEAHSQSLGQNPAPIELDGLAIVACFRDGVYCRNELGGKARNERVY